MTNPFIAALLAQAAGKPKEEEQDTLGFLPDDPVTPAAQDTVGFLPDDPALVTEVPSRQLRRGGTPEAQEELVRREEFTEFFRTIGQAQATFAPDITGRAIDRPEERTILQAIGAITPDLLPLLAVGPAALGGLLTGDPAARELFRPREPLTPEQQAAIREQFSLTGEDPGPIVAVPPESLLEVIDTNIATIPPNMIFSNLEERRRIVADKEMGGQEFLATGGGPAGAALRAFRDLDARLENDFFGTVLQLASAPFVIGYMGMRAFLQNTTITDPNDPNANPRLLRLDAVRNAYFDRIGRLNHYELQEANRGMQALLATGAYGFAVKLGLGPGTMVRNLRSRGIVRDIGGASTGEALGALSTEGLAGTTEFRTIQEVLNFAEASATTGEILRGVEQVENFLNLSGGLSTFGFFAAEPGQKADRAVTFALSAVPLYAVFSVANWVRGITVLSTFRAPVRSPSRALRLNQANSARPFDRPTSPVPDIRVDTGDIPMGRDGFDFEVIPTIETPGSSEFSPRSSIVETARAQQARIETAGIPDPSPIPSSIAERRANSDRSRREIFQIEERRKPTTAAGPIEDPSEAIRAGVVAFLESAGTGTGNALEGLTPSASVILKSEEFSRRLSSATDVFEARDIVRVALRGVDLANFSVELVVEILAQQAFGLVEEARADVVFETDFEVGRRVSERRDRIKNAEKREISFVRNEIMETFEESGVTLEGNLFKILGSESFAIAFMEARGSFQQQFEMVKEILEANLEERTLKEPMSPAELITLAEEIVRSLNDKQGERQIKEITAILDIASTGEVPQGVPDILGDPATGQRTGRERRQRGGRRGEEGRERRRGGIPFSQRPEGIGIINDIILLTLRKHSGDILLSRAELGREFGLAFSSGNAARADLMRSVLETFERHVPPGVEVMNEFQGFPTTTRRITPGGVTEVLTFEAMRLSAGQLEALAAGREIERVNIENEVLGEDLAIEWRRVVELADGGGTSTQVEAALRKIDEIEADLTEEEIARLDGIRPDEFSFGIDNLESAELRDLAEAKRNWLPTADPKIRSPLEEFPDQFLIDQVTQEFIEPKTLGVVGAISFIKQSGIFQELLSREIAPEDIRKRIVDRLVDVTGMLSEDAERIVQTSTERMERANRRLDSVPYRTTIPEPLVPSEIAEDAAIWLRNNGDLVGALVDQVVTKKTQTVIIRGEETPAAVLALVAERLAPDVELIVHPREDGLFDIVLAGPGSYLRGDFGRGILGTQFAKDGFFNGQEISINGQPAEYMRTEKDNIIVRDKVTGKIREVARSLVRNVRDVKTLNEFARVAAAQRHLPEKAMLRIKDAQISQVYQWMAEYVGDLTRLMSESIELEKGNFNRVLQSVDKLIRVMEPLDELQLRINREVAENSVIKSNPIVLKSVLDSIRKNITPDTRSLSISETRDLSRLRILARDYAAFHGEIPTINRVQTLARQAAVALGEFKFEEALTNLQAIQGELGKGRDNWEKVTSHTTTPSIREILEEHLDKEELESYDNLVRELAPPNTQQLLESGIEFSFDNVRTLANTNGMRLEINISGTYVLRGQDAGYELFASSDIRDVVKFIRDSGQKEGLDMDGAHPVDPNIPGSVMPPPGSPPRPNEPFPFPAERIIEMIAEGYSASLGVIFTPFRDWAAAHDGSFGTNVHSEVWLKVDPTAFQSAAVAKIWLASQFERNIRGQKVKVRPHPGLKDIESLFNRVGIKTKTEREKVIQWLRTQSKEELLKSHLEGGSPFQNRSLNANEKDTISILDAIAASAPAGDASSLRAFSYLDDLKREFTIAANAAKVPVEELPIEEKTRIALEIQARKNYTPHEVAVAEIFDLVKKNDLNELSLYGIVKTYEAGRTGALSRDEYVKINQISSEKVAAYKELEAWYSRIGKDPRVDISDIRQIRGYEAQYGWREQMVPENAYLNQKGRNKELEFVNAMIRTGDANPYVKDPIEAAARYAKGASQEVAGFNKAWNEAEKYMQQNLKKGSLARMVVESYLGAVRGNQPALTKITQDVVDGIYKKMGWKVPPNVMRDGVNTVLSLMSSAAIGLRPGLTVRDFFTWQFMHYSRFGGSAKGSGVIRRSLESFGGLGPSRTIRALRLGTERFAETGKELRDSGIVPSIGPIQFQTPSELLSSNLGDGIKKLPAAMQDLANKGFVLGGQKHMYEIAFTGTLLESREFVGEASRRYQKGDVTKEEFYNIIKLDAFQRAVQKEFDDLINTGDFETATELLSRQSAVDMLGLYGMANHPWGWGTNIGRLFTQFGQWPASAFQTVLGGMTRGSKSGIPVIQHIVSKRQIGFATRFAMTQAAVWSTGMATGLNFYGWFLFPGIFFTGGPALQVAQDVMDLVNGTDEQKRDAARSLKNLLPEIDLDDFRNTDIRSMFFPFSYFIGDITEAIKAFENGESLPGVGGRFFGVPLSDKPSWLDTGSPFFFRGNE